MNDYTVHAMVDGQKILISSVQASYYTINEEGFLLFFRQLKGDRQGVPPYMKSGFEQIACFAKGMWSGVELVETKTQPEAQRWAGQILTNGNGVYDPIEQQGINDTAPHDDERLW